MRRVPLVICSCLLCGKEFSATARDVRVGRGKFCSRQCGGRRSAGDRAPIELRFWSKVDKSGPCWEWRACINAGGYGTIGRRGGSKLAHRIAWEMANGPVPLGAIVCHHCDNRRCVRPAHLFLGTHKDNSVDAVTKGRTARGEKATRAILTEAQVLLIRESYIKGVVTMPMLADRFGVSKWTINSVLRRDSWRHV